MSYTKATDGSLRIMGKTLLIGGFTSLITFACLITPAVSQQVGADGYGTRKSALRVAAAPTALTPRKEAKPYFIEFRARAAHSYGHTFAVHGRVGQKITADRVVGLHPASESPIPWMIGHLILVPSETGASDGDTEDEYTIARYRILLSGPEYQRVTDYMKELRGKSPVWHAVFYNCNAFVADIAKSMGLKTPSSSLMMPKEFITELKDLNTRAAGAKHATAADQSIR